MMIDLNIRLSVETIQKQENLKMRKIYTFILVALLAVTFVACAPAPTDTSGADAAAAA